MKSDVITITNLNKYYGSHQAVSNLNLSVHQGEIFGFLGANGAGKSTVIRCILRLVSKTSGDIVLLGGAYSSLTEALAHIGYLPSEAHFYPDMKVRDVIRLAAKARKIDCQTEADRICKFLEVPLDKKIKDLSLGNRKKVSIVCALQHKPRLLLLDEPTSGLDPLMQERFFTLIKEACLNGATCFLSSHNLSEVKNYCDRAAIIKEGKLLVVDTVDHLTRSQTKNVTIWKDGQEKQFRYDGTSEDLLNHLVDLAPTDFLVEEPSLEDLFLHYYEEVEK